MFKTLLVAVAMFGLAQTAQARGARQMIAAANPYAAQAGLDMLARGGGAVEQLSKMVVQVGEMPNGRFFGDHLREPQIDFFESDL